MERSPRWILAAANLLLALPLSGADAPTGTPSPGGRILFWIRAGALSEAEIDPDPETVPRLRELVLAGVTAVELTAEKRPELLGAAGLADALFARSALERVREVRGSPAVRLGPELDPEAPEGSRGGSADDREPKDRAIAILAPRFGSPPPPSPGEEAALLRIRAAIGDVPAARGVPPPTGSEPAISSRRATPSALLAAAARALKEGAPLVIVCEQVEDPSRAPERDRVLGEAEQVAGGAGAVLFLVSSFGGGAAPPRRMLVAAGPGVRRGRIIAEPKPLECVIAAALAILDVPPPAGPLPERIHVLEK